MLTVLLEFDCIGLSVVAHDVCVTLAVAAHAAAFGEIIADSRGWKL